MVAPHSLIQSKSSETNALSQPLAIKLNLWYNLLNFSTSEIPTAVWTTHKNGDDSMQKNSPSTISPSEIIYYSVYPCAMVGEVFIASTDKGICSTSYSGDTLENFLAWLQRRFPGATIAEDQERNRVAAEQIVEYFARKRRTFDLPLDMRGTEFQIRVWQELLKIPYGETISYGELSRRVSGDNKSSRAVGGANNKNPIGIIVPCHRVIGSNGKLVGYAGGLNIKEMLLNLENDTGNLKLF